MKYIIFFFVIFIALLSTQSASHSFYQEKRRFYSIDDGLPTLELTEICVDEYQTVYVGTKVGLFYLADSTWKSEFVFEDCHILDLVSEKDHLQVLYKTSDQIHLAILQKHNIIKNKQLGKKFDGGRLLCANHLATNDALYRFDASDNKIKPKRLARIQFKIYDAAPANDGNLWLAADAGLFRYYQGEKSVLPIYPASGDKSWALTDVQGLATDANGHVWFAAAQGVGSFDGLSWHLYDGDDGLPYNAFTSIDAGGDGAIWFGTDKGAIRFDGEHWSYRQGKRWLPDDFVTDIAVSEKGDAYCATSHGISVIERVPMTLAQKARWYEDEIDRYHRRTPFEYVLHVQLENPSDKRQDEQQAGDDRQADHRHPGHELLIGVAVDPQTDRCEGRDDQHPE